MLKNKGDKTVIYLNIRLVTGEAFQEARFSQSDDTHALQDVQSLKEFFLFRL